MRLAVLCLLLCFVGCVEPEPTVVALRPPKSDVPTLNVPLSMRQKNWLGNQREGSCVYASTVNVLRGLNLLDLADRIRQKYGNGATQYDIIAALSKEGLKQNEDFDCTFKADPSFLDWADRNGQGAIVWWKPSHCCSFHGWVTKPDGKVYAAILDNNFIQDFELVERSQFLRLWAGYGGFGLSVMHDPATLVPYQSYELVYE